MKIMSLKNTTVLVLTAVLAFQSVSLHAFGWEWPDAESSRNGRIIEALILTANYVTPRRLAFIAQQETKVPVILLPAADSVDRNIYLFIPDGKDAVVIPPADLSRYISYINARKVIVIGGTEVVDPRWRAAIEAVYPVQDLDSDNQYLNALALSNALQSPDILKRYQALIKKDQEKRKKLEKKKLEKKNASSVPEAAKDEVKLTPPAEKEPAPVQDQGKTNLKDTKAAKPSAAKK